MSDLAEIRQFWPRATTTLAGVYTPTRNPLGFRSWYLSQKSDGEWLLSDWCEIEKTFTWHAGPTIAAAMAAAGFAQRPKGGHSKRRAMLATSAKLHPMLPGKTRIPLESRQRPRKKVRLGKRGRRLALAASIGEALELVRQKRLDRGEIGG